ncbi:nuclear pore complex protein Nup88 [Onthophagus taurus]|uniref:nuclear pore complex protein Nup88 n=2 Tax=Onthophagus taurus TaxID=166361 RepID=UPI0039BE4CD8
MSSTDFLQLNRHDIFKNLRETLPKNIATTKNVLVVKEDVLYTWDFQDNCLLTLNIKALRENDPETIKHQSLVTTSPPLFSPTSLVVNESNTLVVAVASTGVLIIELPSRSAPYGLFENNKELIYCRSHALLESLAFNGNVEICQVKFHIGSHHDNHVLILTSNNVLRLYTVSEGSTSCLGTYSIGIQPIGRFPATKTSFLEALGDTAVDFDFGQPEIKKTQPKSKLKSKPKSAVDRFNNLNISSFEMDQKINLDWPIYVLYKNGDVYVVILDLFKSPAIVKGPLEIFPKNQENYGENSCSILALPSIPTILCISTENGTIHHGIILSTDQENEDYILEMSKEERPSFIKNPDRALYIFECIELELGYLEDSISKTINFHPNQANSSQYFVYHLTGVHSIHLKCLERLNKFIDFENDCSEIDIFSDTSLVDYVLCTNLSQKVDEKSENLNPVIGFTIFYDFPSILILLSNSQLVTLPLSSLFSAPNLDLNDPDDLKNMNSPLKTILNEPFDVKIQKILQLSSNPILKIQQKTNPTQQECFDLLQNSSKLLRERFKNHFSAKNEIEKRLKTLSKLKELQKGDILKLKDDQIDLRNTAESLAEKYEDIKDKQDEILKRCETLLVQISKRKVEPSKAEKSFLGELEGSGEKIVLYGKAIQKLKEKIKYQEIQMKNWHDQTKSEHKSIGIVQIEAIKSNLQDMTEKITNMISEINDYKKQIHMK